MDKKQFKTPVKYVMLFLFSFRLLFAAIQTAYIHPDEFMQSTEITAGDVFGLKATRTWEWNRSSPLRCATLPYLLSGILFIMTKALDLRLNSWSMLVLSRIWMTLISFATDFLIFKICKILGKNSLRCFMLFATSYVVLVFNTRTFSNPIELLLFTALLHLALVPKETRGTRNINSVIEKLLPIILAFGVFSRPTFPLFAFVPMLVWVTNVSKTSLANIIKNVTRQAFWLVPQFIFVCIFLAITDSIYHGSLKIDELELTTFKSDALFRALANISWTPLNFIKYNGNNANLVKHGLHPWYFHTLFNLPLLFGVYGIVGFVQCFREIIVFVKSKIKPKKRGSSKLVVAISALAPLALLSVFPHHEARYILPILTPLILLSFDVVFSSKILLFLHISHNIIGLLVMGFFHQGGLTPCMHHLSERLRPDINAGLNIVFYETYMPPQHLLMLPRNTSVNVIDFAGMPRDEFADKFSRLLTKKKIAKTYLITPYPVLEQLSSKFRFDIIDLFFPHASMENFPDVNRLFRCDADSEYCSKSTIERLKMQFSLALLSTSHIRMDSDFS